MLKDKDNISFKNFTKIMSCIFCAVTFALYVYDIKPDSSDLNINIDKIVIFIGFILAICLILIDKKQVKKQAEIIVGYSILLFFASLFLNFLKSVFPVDSIRGPEAVLTWGNVYLAIIFIAYVIVPTLLICLIFWNLGSIMNFYLNKDY